MKYPNIWGQGALFTFSGCDGECNLGKAVCGTYAADRLGFLFDNGATEFYLDLKDINDFYHEIVASDVLITRLNGNKKIIITFADQNTIVGTYPKALAEPIFATKENSDYYILVQDGRFVLTTDDKKLDKTYSVEELANEKLDFYNKISVPYDLDNETERTLAKCFSTLKSQVYTEQGIFKHRWTTPDKLPHRYLWLWDSVFHSMGNVFADESLSLDSLCAVMDSQLEDGFIPHLTAPDFYSDITQPPIIVWGFYEWYQKTKDIKPLKEYYEKLKLYLLWNENNRDSNKNGLFEWKINLDDPDCRCGECGMDNSPRFDDPTPMECVDFSCFMANEMQYMAKIARLLDCEEDAVSFENKFNKIQKAMNEQLYFEDDGLYYDKSLTTGELKRVKAVSCLLPLFAGICDKKQAKKLVEAYERDFCCEAGVSSIATGDDTYGTDMWRGPTWINYNYFVILGLLRYGENEKAKELIEKTIEVIRKFYLSSGTVFEFYDAASRLHPGRLNRKGIPVEPYFLGIRVQSIRDYGWTAALFIKLIYDYDK